MKFSRQCLRTSFRYERLVDSPEYLKVRLMGVQFLEMKNKVKEVAQDLGLSKGDLTLSQEFLKIL
jgi:hypothetical protein